MVKRRRIGLSYTYNENWIGGTYYIENLISALNTLADQEKPHIVLITNNQWDLAAAKKKISYPYTSFQLGSGEINRPFQFFNKVTNRLLKIRAFSQIIKDLDAVFPYYDCVQQSGAKNKIHWIADFQEHFAPEFFSDDTVKARIANQHLIQASTEQLILSSNDALQHFKLFYPNHSVKVSVMPFAVTHPDFTQLDIHLLLKKFDLPARYFICPNQFWKHKNQIIVLKAVKLLKDKGINLTVAFTGNTEDYRNPDYFMQLKAYLAENNLGEQINFLGFIDRAEQLQLMNNSAAIIQPSLFEGWSTVVEDAKAMNKFLLVSGINVHREQLSDSAAEFFDPLNAADLANAMEKTYLQNTPPSLYLKNTYEKNVHAFAANFLEISGRYPGLSKNKNGAA